MADISLVSRINTTAGTRRIAKNMAKTARRQLGGRHLLFGEYLRSWTNLNDTIEDELNIDAGKHVLAMFLN